MSSKEVIARYVSHGKKFEILVYADKAWKLKQNQPVDIREVLVGDIVYYDVRRGLKASPEDLKKVFGTDDVYKVAYKIIKHGELQLTAQQRKELIEAKKKQIIEFITRNCVDPRTGLPIPPKRVELALEEAKVGIDPFLPVEVQINNILKALRSVLPLKIAKSIVRIKIPPSYVGKTYGYIMKVGKVLSSNYQSDGTWLVELEIPAGMQSSLIEQLNKLTKGSAEVKIVSTA